jgi:hypothetical protein
MALAKITTPAQLGIQAKKLERPKKFEDFPLFLKMLIFGPSGIGKTILAATADDVEELSPSLYVSVENGEMSIMMYDKFTPDLWTIPFPDFRAANMVYALLCTYITVRDKLAETPTDPEKAKLMKLLAEENVKWGLPLDYLPKSVIVDSITEMNKRIMDFIGGIDCTVTAREFEPEMEQLQDWGKGSNATEKFLRALRDLPFHIFLIATDNLYKDESTGAVWVMPELPGKLPGKVSAYYEVVTYYMLKGKDRVLLMQPEGRIRCKDRTNAFGAGVKDPTMQKLWNIYIDYKRKLWELTGSVDTPKVGPVSNATNIRRQALVQKAAEAPTSGPEVISEPKPEEQLKLVQETAVKDEPQYL